MEKATLNELMKHTRYPLKLRVQDPWHKVYVLMQAAIGNTDIKDFTLRVEQAEIVECALRVLSALRELGICREVGTLLESTLLLDRSLRTRMWECHYGSIFTQCPSLSPTVRNSLTLRNVRTIGDVMGCSLSTVQEMCGGSQAEARAILALAKTLYEGTLEVTASVAEGVLTIRIASTTHSTGTSTNTVPVDATYPQYTLLAYNVFTSKALCIRNVDRGTRSTQHSVDVGPLLPIEHIKCCFLCTNYVGIDSYQQAAVEVPNVTSDGTAEATSTNTSRKKANTNQPTTSPNVDSTTSNNNAHSNSTTSATSTAKPSPARNLKQTTLRTTSVVDNGLQAGLHGTPYGVRTTTTGYNKASGTNNSSKHSENISSNYTPPTVDGTASVEPSELSSTNSQAIERARAYLDRSRTSNENSIPAQRTSAPNAKNVNVTTTSFTAATTHPNSNTSSNTASRKQTFGRFAYTDIDDAAIGLDEDEANLTNLREPAYPTAHNSVSSYNNTNTIPNNNYPPTEDMVFEGEDISDYYYPTTKKTLPPLKPAVPKINAPRYKSNQSNRSTNNSFNTNSVTEEAYQPQPITEKSEGRNVSNEVSAMRRKAAELDLLSLPVQRINRQRVWGGKTTNTTNDSSYEVGNTHVSPAVATVSPPTYSSPTTAPYPIAQDINSCNNYGSTISNFGGMGRKRSFFDRDGPVIPLCEEFDNTTTGDYYSNNYDSNYNNYNNGYNNSDNYTTYNTAARPPTPIQQQQQHVHPRHYRFNPSQLTPLEPYTATNSVPSRTYPAMSPPAAYYNRATTTMGMGKENDANKNIPAPVTVAPPLTQQPIIDPAYCSSFGKLLPSSQNKNKVSPPEAKKILSEPVHGEFDSIFF